MVDANEGLPSSSAGKESACNEGDPGPIPGLGRSPGEGIGYSLQYSWASLVAQMVKNLPECRFINAEDIACSLPQSMGDGFHPWVRKIPWRRAWQPTPVFLPGESHGQRSLVGCSP